MRHRLSVFTFSFAHPAMSRYASNQEVMRFFASHGIEVTHVRREGDLRHLRVHGLPVCLPMPASADECLRLVRAHLAAQASAGMPPHQP